MFHLVYSLDFFRLCSLYEISCQTGRLTDGYMDWMSAVCEDLPTKEVADNVS